MTELTPITSATGLPPLVVDLDGTLTPTDTLIESIISLLKQSPLYLFKLVLWLLNGRAAFKRQVASHSHFTPVHLPWRPELLAYLREQHAQNRRLVLATAADDSIAQVVAREIGLFDQVIASDGLRNLKGKAKLEAIQQAVGPRFVYAGDSVADLPIWQAAEAAILVGTSDAVRKAVVANGIRIEQEFVQARATWRVWARALRIHQWVKNFLIFVPLLTAFGFGDLGKCIAALLAFIAFSLAASATYIGNDLWDLDNDRQHPRKKSRPLASGLLSIPAALGAANLLLVTAFTIAMAVSPAFAGMLAGYTVLTVLYSWVLKQYVLVDVIMLALLYTLRVLAGAVAISVPISPWLLAFSVFTFFSLALVKRCAELVTLQHQGKRGSHGRDYQVSDLVVLWPLGIGASLCSVVVFGLFIGTPATQARYGNTDALWLVGIGLIYWFARLWIKTARGEMHDDPIVFALYDFGSRVAILCMLVTTVAARYLPSLGVS